MSVVQNQIYILIHLHICHILNYALTITSYQTAEVVRLIACSLAGAIFWTAGRKCKLSYLCCSQNSPRVISALAHGMTSSLRMAQGLGAKPQARKHAECNVLEYHGHVAAWGVTWASLTAAICRRDGDGSEGEDACCGAYSKPSRRTNRCIWPGGRVLRSSALSSRKYLFNASWALVLPAYLSSICTL